MRVAIAISGGIAAYKIPELIRLLSKNHHQVKVVMSKRAQDFVTPLTLESVSHHPIISDGDDHMAHIELARWADVLLIAPATANTLAKMAHGIADNVLTTTYLASSHIPVVIAPAMNQAMWAHPATQENIAILKKRAQHTIIMPEAGEQACGDVGIGRLASLDTLVFACERAKAPHALAGKRVVITAGATREAIDPIRFISNHSSGKMGYALARAVALYGAEVHLIHGVTALADLPFVTHHPVDSAQEMCEVAQQLAKDCTIFIGCAAVADYRVKEVSAQKIKKRDHALTHLELIENPDIIQTIATSNPRPLICVGFAAETHNLLAYAQEKCVKKHLDWIIANDVSHNVFASDENHIHILDKNGVIAQLQGSKTALGEEILSYLIQQLDKLCKQ